MEIIRDLEELSRVNVDTGVALGTFDGLHIGHQEVIRKMILNCQRRNLKSCVFTFANHPRELTTKTGAPPRILTLDDKVKLLESYGVDILVILNFDKRLMSIEPDAFVRDILIKGLNTRYLTVGFDFRFGKKAAGNVELLRAYAQDGHYEVDIVSPVVAEGEKISSSAIRALLKEGRIEDVNSQLGRHYHVSGEVVAGKRVGNTIGFPTANLKISSNMTLIKPGVYVTKTTVRDTVYYSVSNVGYNPTFDQKMFNLETYILDFNKDIYHEIISVEFHTRIRDEIKMDSLEQLIDSIKKDVGFAKEYFNIH
jgi:riboflavin kinase/FMN adenylyltransferase